MAREVVIGKQILVVTHNGHFRVADISDIVTQMVDRDSIRSALEGHFQKHGLRMATAEEAQRRGFPTREPRLDRQPHLPRRRFIR